MTMKNIYISFAILAACGAVISSCHHKSSETDDALTTVDVAVPEVDSVSLSYTLPGTLVSGSTVDIVARVNGTLESQNYSDGQYVRAGDVLFTIESTRYRDAVAQAEAALATAISTRDYARSHYEAVNKALESDAVSRMEVLQAESAYRQAEASIENARAALATARKMLGYCTIRAPFSGNVTSSPFDPGAYIGGEVSPVTMAQIYNNSKMIAEFSIDDTQYMELVKALDGGDKTLFDNVPVELGDTLPHSYSGNLTYVAPALNSSTGTMKLRCDIENPYDELRSGMFVRIRLPYGTEPHAVLVKDASIGTSQLGKYLYVVNDSDKVVYTPVTVGELCRDSLRMITSGIRPGQRYVTRAMLKVRDGMQVRPHMVR